jgi:hypothetical protein
MERWPQLYWGATVATRRREQSEHFAAEAREIER